MEYFEQELNVKDDREANRQDAENEMKLGKPPGWDNFPVECLKKSGVTYVRATFD